LEFLLRAPICDREADDSRELGRVMGTSVKPFANAIAAIIVSVGPIVWPCRWEVHSNAPVGFRRPIVEGNTD
jgi:hypothetical protein